VREFLQGFESIDVMTTVACGEPFSTELQNIQKDSLSPPFVPTNVKIGPKMASNSGKRIAFTGGSGKTGRHVLPYLLSKGYKVLNLDLIDFPKANLPTGGSIYTLKTDLSESGQAMNALTSLFDMGEYALPKQPGPPDAVIHFAAYARNMLVPDNECFRANVMSTYNVIEAACKLGVKKIIIASSETTYGVCFTQGEDDYHSFPLDEDTYDVNPMDTYACSKLCGERIARTFARRFGVDIYVLRIGNVIEPHEYERDFPTHVGSPETRKRNAWSYIDARDLGQICDLCVAKSGLGFQIFNATNDTITTTVPTAEFLKKTCPNTPITREMGEWEAPLSNRKIREVLGYKDVHNWRKYYSPEKKEVPVGGSKHEVTLDGGAPI
jgi:nucleoside-diphosphate-sugar epimerase